jgi:hypothetical protein
MRSCIESAILYRTAARRFETAARAERKANAALNRATVARERAEKAVRDLTDPPAYADKYAY